jgi:hypothetical protein
MAIEAAREAGILNRSEAAEALWAEIYDQVDDDVDGVIGSLTARAEAQMLRLSVAYALLDGSETIEVDHLQAARAVWQHCEASIRRVYGQATPDHVVPRLLLALQEAGEEGLDGSQQRDLFSRHMAGSRLAAARLELERRGLAETQCQVTGGRPRLLTRLAADARPVRSLSSPSWLPPPGAACTTREPLVHEEGGL